MFGCSIHIAPAGPGTLTLGYGVDLVWEVARAIFPSFFMKCWCLFSRRGHGKRCRPVVHPVRGPGRHSSQSRVGSGIWSRWLLLLLRLVPGLWDKGRLWRAFLSRTGSPRIATIVAFCLLTWVNDADHGDFSPWQLTQGALFYFSLTPARRGESV